MTEEHARNYAKSVAKQLGMSGEDVEDAGQLGAIKNWELSERHKGYRFQAIYNAVVDMARGIHHRDRTTHLAWVHCEGPLAPQEEPHSTVDMRLSLESALLEANPGQVDCAKLLMMGLSSEEAAAVMGITQKAFGCRMVRLRKFLEPFGIF